MDEPLEELDADKPQALCAVKDIQSEIRGMDEIIREFMNFSQPTELNVTEVEVGGLVEESVRALAPNYPSSAVPAVTRLTPSCCTTTGRRSWAAVRTSRTPLR